MLLSCRRAPFGKSTLNFAVAAVLAIAIVGALSSYLEKYMTTSIGQWIAHDLRRTLYNHMQRLSLAQYDETRTGDLVTRVTGDVDAIQTFINSALLGSIVNVLTLVGMLGLYVNWRSTLVALSVIPVLFFVVFSLTRRIKEASREESIALSFRHLQKFLWGFDLCAFD